MTFVATTQRIATGETFLLELAYKRWPNRFLTAAVAQRVQAALPRRGQRAGVWLSLSQSTLAKLHAYDEAIANAKPLIKRRYERLPIHLPIGVVVGSQRYEMQTEDIGIGGAALRGRLPRDVQEFVIEISPPGNNSRPMALAAKLVHARTVANGEQVLGAQFVNKTADGTIRIAEILRRIVTAL